MILCLLILSAGFIVGYHYGYEGAYEDMQKAKVKKE